MNEIDERNPSCSMPESPDCDARRCFGAAWVSATGSIRALSQNTEALERGLSWLHPDETLNSVLRTEALTIPVIAPLAE